jgi:cardiolipin synthase A/B
MSIRELTAKRVGCGYVERPNYFLEPVHCSNERSQRNRYKGLKQILLAALIALSTGAGCGTIPNALALIDSSQFYREYPQFVAAPGPLSTAQGKEIVARLERQAGKIDILARHLAFEQTISGSPLIVGNRVTLLKNSSTTYPAMLDAIRSARDSINLETFIFSDDFVGRTFASALIAKQRQGVQVNIIYDSFGSYFTAESLFESLRANGIRLLSFNPMNPWNARVRWSPDHRDHRKLLVVDGKIAFTGGINISSHGLRTFSASGEEDPNNGLSDWRDTDLEIQGPAVAAFQRLFVTMWISQHGVPLGRRDYFPMLQNRGNDIVRVLGSVPEQFSVIYVTLISAINNAERNVYVTDAYFAPGAQMLEILEAAAQRGVDVRLLVPGRTNEPLIGPATRSHYSELLGAGIRIYEWRGKMLHAKTTTIDGVWSTVGSSNLDWWSIARNNEVNAVILSTDLAERMNLMFREDIENSNQITLELWRKRSLTERIEELVARCFEPLL